MINDQDIIYDIALTFVPGFGPVTIKKTLQNYGSAKNFFEQKEKELIRAPFIIKDKVISGIKDQLLKIAEDEIKFCKKNGIEILTVNDEKFPSLLKEIYDPPHVLYVKGNTNLNNNSKKLAVVGTRKATNYGKSICKEIINELSSSHNDLEIISGLALGIDTCAHKSALENQASTVAVLGHGFLYLYPAQNKKLARDIVENNSTLITEYPKNTKPDGFNFVKRNRIIAGIAEGTLIVESGIKGGALITANIASSYNREVMAIPGRTIDIHSAGCNNLIKNNKAVLIENAEDIEKVLNWDLLKPKKIDKKTVSLSESEKKIVEILQTEGKTNINTLSKLSRIDLSNLSLHLINLEMKGVVKSLPGNFYDLT
jgi:DNA processing protein